MEREEERKQAKAELKSSSSGLDDNVQVKKYSYRRRIIILRVPREGMAFSFHPVAACKEPNP